MSSFHDQLAVDNSTVFYNKDELAIVIKWNGFPITVSDANPSEQTLFTHGLSSTTIIFRCDQKAFDSEPEADEEVRINDDHLPWRVISVKKALNDYIIRLDRLTT